MTKIEFKARWKSGGITFEDVADCAVLWGISTHPKVQPVDVIRYKVLKAADTTDAETYRPVEF